MLIYEFINPFQQISEISDFTRFQTRAFCVIAKYGLQLDAKKEELFSGDEWKNKTIPKQHLTINIKNILLLERSQDQRKH